ncbi:MAG: 3-hydroxybutyryl-CoA dehydrogenase [Gammaproteobacteria bacterium]|nr:3-hydroxybutyryl-CoA dehydrogenase [Gammaproteobacteria bacterium]
MSINTIGVVGAGTMGSGIAQAAAVSGCAVVLQDVSEEQIARARKGIERSLSRLVDKGAVDRNVMDNALASITTTTAVDDLAGADMVIEAAVENMDLKLELFAKLDRLMKAGAVLASNTSSLSLTRLAAATARPDKVVGMHFFNPVPLMKLVEVIRALQTSDETHALADEFARRLGKVPVSVKDSPGFVVNRMLVPMINEAVFLLYEGVASAGEIDEAMKLGANHPIGPLALADMIGVDVCYFVMQILLEEFGDSKYRPCPLLKQMVGAGRPGRKSGRGFFDYAA